MTIILRLVYVCYREFKNCINLGKKYFQYLITMFRYSVLRTLNQSETIINQYSRFGEMKIYQTFTSQSIHHDKL